MRILLITSYFPPDSGSAANLFYELGSALVKRGHEISVVTSTPSYHAKGSLERYQGHLWVSEEVHGMAVTRLAIPNLARNSRIGRGLWQFASAAAFTAGCLLQTRADVALVYSPPLPLGLAALAARLLRHTPFVLNVQDLFPQSAVDLGLLNNNTLIRLFERLERFLYRRAAYVTVHSEGNKEHVIRKGADEARVSVFQNWIDTDFIRPGPRLNDFSHSHGLDDSFVVLFGGVIGHSQDIDVILDAAARLRDRPEIVFLVVGDGVEKARVEQKARDMALSSVRFLPMLPRDQYTAVIHASDVCLTTLRANVKTPVVPSKIVTAMAAGRPVIAIMNSHGDAPALIEQADSGVSAQAGDADALAAYVSRLCADPELGRRMGRNGRQFAERYLSLTVAAHSYEQLLAAVAGIGPHEPERALGIKVNTTPIDISTTSCPPAAQEADVAHVSASCE